MDQPVQHHYPINSATGRWTLVATILASSIAFIDTTALNVILPSLQKDLNATGGDLFWILNSYLMILAALIIPGGALGDKLGRVKVFKVGIGIFSVGSVLCGLAPTIELLIVFRAIQGIGGAFMIPGSLAIISATFEPAEKGKAIGSWSAITTLVTIGGPILGGALADLGLWRLIFHLNLPIGLFAIWILHTRVPESKEGSSTIIDWQGAALLTLGLALLTFGFLQMPEWTATHPLVYLSLIAGIGLLTWFLIFEWKNPEAMVPMNLFKNKMFAGLNLLTFFLYGGLGAIMVFLSLNLIQIQGYTQLQAGLTFLPFSILMFASARWTGKITDERGPRFFLIVGPALTGVGCLMLSFIGETTGPGDYWSEVLPGFMFFAGGMSLTVVPLTTSVMAIVPESKAGIASGINNSVTRISGTIINAILGAWTILMFTQWVQEQVTFMALQPEQISAILEEARKLGEANAGNLELSDPTKTSVNEIFRSSFVNTYRLVGWISAAMCFLSTLIAVFTVSNKKVTK